MRMRKSSKTAMVERLKYCRDIKSKSSLELLNRPQKTSPVLDCAFGYTYELEP